MRKRPDFRKETETLTTRRRSIAAALILGLCAAVCFGGAATALAEVESGAPGNGEPERLRLSRDQALWTALAFEDSATLRRLLGEGADPNRPDELSMMTPLMAVETAALAEALLEAGADVAARDRQGRTPLHYAVRMRESASIIPLLAQRGADPNAHATGARGVTPLMTAVEAFFEDLDKARCARLLRSLVRAGARIDETDDRGDTPLALAAVNNAPELVKLLLQLGADPSLRLRDGRTAADCARERGSNEVAALLDRAAGDRVHE